MSRRGSIAVAICGLLAACTDAATLIEPQPSCLVRPRVPREPGLDQDRDGLSDLTELALGTDPLDADSDDDGQPDGMEQRGWGTSPFLTDSDHDGASDGAELFSRYTDPLHADPLPEGAEPRPKQGIKGPSGPGPSISLPPQSPLQPVDGVASAPTAPIPAIASATSRSTPAPLPALSAHEGRITLPSTHDPDLVWWNGHLCTTLPGPALLCLDPSSAAPTLHASLDVIPEGVADLPPPSHARLHAQGPHLISITDTGVITAWRTEGPQWSLHAGGPIRDVHLRHVLLVLTEADALVVRLSPSSVQRIESPSLAAWDHALLTEDGLRGWQDDTLTLLAASSPRSGFRERPVHQLISDARFVGSPWVDGDFTIRWTSKGQLWRYRNYGPSSLASPLGLDVPLSGARRTGAGWWLHSDTASWYLADDGAALQLPAEALAATADADGGVWIRSQTALFQSQSPVVATLP